MSDLFFTPLTGHVVGDVYYAQAIRESDNLIWNGTTVVAAPAYADTDIALTEINGMGIWSFTAPASLPVGIYSIVCRKQAGVNPDPTDNVPSGEGVKRIEKTLSGRVIVL